MPDPGDLSAARRRPRIVLTGGSGLLGSHLLPLLRDEAELHLLGGRDPGLEGVTHYPLDLTEGLGGARLPARADIVVHLAQSRRFRDFPDGAGHVLAVNVAAAVELARYAARSGARRFVHLSSGSVYARSTEPIEESAPLGEEAELGFYAASKIAAERLLAPFADRFRLVTLRPFFIYGGGQDPSMLIPRLVEQVRRGTPIRLAGDGGMRLNPIHAADAAAAVSAALRLEGSYRLNIAGPEILSLRAIGEAIGTALGIEPAFEQDPRAGKDLVGSIDAMCKFLVPPTIRFAYGVRDLLTARQEGP